MAKEQRVIKIHGKVQGVGYRFFATRVARRLGLKGSIENIRDGYVEAIVEGDKGVIDEWIEELKEGPRYAEVTSIEYRGRAFFGSAVAAVSCFSSATAFVALAIAVGSRALGTRFSHPGDVS